jgi:hypothetical protein
MYKLETHNLIVRCWEEMAKAKYISGCLSTLKRGDKKKMKKKLCAMLVLALLILAFPVTVFAVTIAAVANPDRTITVTITGLGNDFGEVNVPWTLLTGAMMPVVPPQSSVVLSMVAPVGNFVYVLPAMPAGMGNLEGLIVGMTISGVDVASSPITLATVPEPDSVVITPAGPVTLALGANQNFTAQVLDQDGVLYANQAVIWTLTGAGGVATGTTFAGGSVVIAADQALGALTLTATSDADTSVYASVTINVVDSDPNVTGVILPPAAISRTHTQVAVGNTPADWGLATTMTVNTTAGPVTVTITWDMTPAAGFDPTDEDPQNFTFTGTVGGLPGTTTDNDSLMPATVTSTVTVVYGVPQTGVADVTMATVSLLGLLVLSGGLWGVALRRKRNAGNAA